MPKIEIDTEKLSRVTVVHDDRGGRIVEAIPVHVQRVFVQDGGRTLKVYMQDREKE